MVNPNIPAKARHFARVFSLGSKAVSLIPLGNRLIVGDNYVPEGWSVYKDPSTALRPWAQFEGDPDGPTLPIPRLYNMVGVVAVAKTELDEINTRFKRNGRPEARQAVAVALGKSEVKAVVYGVLNPKFQFGEDTKYPDQALMPFGIGGGEGQLNCTMGLWLPDDASLHIPESVQAVERLAKSDVPDNYIARVPKN
ncbi:MAG TPA: hypothetical protein VMR95_04105 [Candidatus Binatia bacterium]|nr:hypothetical protein [Candidatus Binatia bacterium]